MRKALFCLFFSVMALQAVTNDPPSAAVREYNPFLAGTLSWYSAGLGQIYTGDYAKGAVFFAIDSTLLYMAINAIADVNISIDPSLGLGVNIALRRDANNKYALNGSFFLIAFLTFHFYNIFDAVLTSTRKNRALQEYRESSSLPPGGAQFLFSGDPRSGQVDMPLCRQRF